MSRINCLRDPGARECVALLRQTFNPRGRARAPTLPRPESTQLGACLDKPVLPHDRGSPNPTLARQRSPKKQKSLELQTVGFLCGHFYGVLALFFV